MEASVIDVGIMTHKTILFVSGEEYVYTETGTFTIGEQRALWVNGKIVYSGKPYQELFLELTNLQSLFDLRAVTIGVDFHQQRQGDQRFRGALNLATADKGIVMINQMDVEGYLTSVISPEMNANAPKELLKVYAMISRGRFLAQVEENFSLNGLVTPYKGYYHDSETLIRWYSREDHDLFDACADGHCQCHQDITQASNPIVREVVKETRRGVLMDNGTVYDARFLKCCGGVTEKFKNCWEPAPHSYLTALRDDEVPSYPDLVDEREAEQWIRTSSEAFCSTTDKKILSQVLNSYDQEIADFYRWKVEYTQEELLRLIHRKTGMDLGPIIDFIPLGRGSPERIMRLKIIGVRCSFIIGKELEIRRTLSETHLYSSAFVVDKKDIRLDIPSRFILTGAGWGRSVGLCQIGTAMMGAKGYSYRKILTHYFPGASIEKRY